MPWCGESFTGQDVKQRIYENSFGENNERRCSECNGILAADAVKEHLISERLRTF